MLVAVPQRSRRGQEVNGQIQHGNAVRNLACTRDIVSDRQCGYAQIANRGGDQIIDDIGHDGVQSGSGFIKENDLRVGGNGACETNAFLHAARQLRGRQIRHVRP